MHRHRATALAVLALPAVVLAAVFLLRDREEAVVGTAPVDETAAVDPDPNAPSDGGDGTFMGGGADLGAYDGPLALQIPLEDTEDARQEFSAILVATREERGYDLLALYEEWIGRIGANGIIDAVEAEFPTCHDEGHDIGKVFYRKTGDIGTALRACQDACYSGCMHGVLMEVFAGEEAIEGLHMTLADVKEKIATVCDGEAMRDMYRKGDCLHGVGHALAFLAEYDVVKAVEYCDLFPTHPERYYCATGAYMEYVTIKDPEDALTKDRFYPCDSSPYPAACFRYKLAHVYRRLYLAKEESPLVIVDECRALDDQYRLGCFHGIGNAHMGFVSVGRLELKALCDRGTREDQYVCIEGVMERLGKFRPENVALACSSVDGWQKELCEESASRAMYDPEKPFDLYQR